MVLAAAISFQLKAKGELYYAADNGFLGGSIKSLVSAFSFGNQWVLYVVYGALFVLLIFL